MVKVKSAIIEPEADQCQHLSMVSLQCPVYPTCVESFVLLSAF